MKNQPKLKTYVLIVSRFYPATHPRKGEQTNFPELIISEDKAHTVRGNYALWKKRADEVQAGRAVISLRFWTGRPYNSDQQEFLQLNNIHVQKVHVYHVVKVIIPQWDSDKWPVYHATEKHTHIFIDNSIQPLRWPFKFAARDGLTMPDFLGWFKKPVENAALIHFSNFKY